MQVKITTAISASKSELTRLMLKEAEIELADDQKATLIVREQPFERFVVFIDTYEKEK